jgi:hypothetical protein
MERLSSCGLEDIETYIQERDLIFAELQQFNPAPDQAAALHPQVLHITEMDTVITGRMTELRDEAKREMDKINRENVPSRCMSQAHIGMKVYFSTLIDKTKYPFIPQMNPLTINCLTIR